MVTENISTLKIHKLTKEQYARELAAGNIDENALYLTPDENSAAGVGISSITQTTTSTDDDGINVITVTLTDGTSSTFIIQNGSKGDKGDSPVRGTDYWTDADKIEIKNYINETIANIPRAEEVTF